MSSMLTPNGGEEAPRANENDTTAQTQGRRIAAQMEGLSFEYETHEKWRQGAHKHFKIRPGVFLNFQIKCWVHQQ